MSSALIPIMPVPVERANHAASFLAGRNERNPHLPPTEMSSVAPRETFEPREERPVKQAGLPGANRSSRRRRRTKGAQMIEFTLNFLPFMMMIIVVVDTAWAIYAQATLQQAVRMGVRTGVTLTNTQVTGNLTDTVKSLVQSHAVGLLKGTTGLSYIKVHYFDQDNPSLDVSATSTGNQPGNIMQVSVQGYPLSPLMARFFSARDTVDKSPMSMTVYAADIIEPVSTARRPAIGPAP